MDSINPVQKQAISHGDGPMLVLAGPGSGKTFVITRRIRYMIQELDIPPENILVITFTKNSAEEMEQRFRSLIGDGSPVRFGTFHAIFFHMLKISSGYDASSIIREKEKRMYLKTILDNMQSEEPLDEYAERILSDISRVKNDGIAPEKATVKYISSELFVRIFKEYDKSLRRSSKLDFDDMVLECRNMLINDDAELKRWREAYKYILIDEFQDINPMQYEVVKLIAYPYNNLFVVGDDDQSIYGFRGSRPEIMRSFPDDFKGTKVVNLSINYRSRTGIVDSAVSLIECNKNRFKKKLEAASKERATLVLTSFDSQMEESEYILKLIATIARNGKYSDMAIIFRTNSAARFLTKALTDMHIPYDFKEKPRSFFDSDVSRDILAILAFASGQKTRKNFLRFMNKPVRYISREMVNRLPENEVNLTKLMVDSRNKAYLQKNIEKLITDINYISGLDMHAAVKYIRRIMGYEEWLIQEAKEHGKDISELKSEVDLFEESVRGKDSFMALCEYIEEYNEGLKEAALSSEEDRVNIVTMHGSKGLEYKTVIIPDLSEGYVPQAKAISFDEIEEERRVFYVAMTRAKENLYLTYVKKNKSNRHDKSRFLYEIKGLKEMDNKKHPR